MYVGRYYVHIQTQHSMVNSHILVRFLCFSFLFHLLLYALCLYAYPLHLIAFFSSLSSHRSSFIHITTGTHIAQISLFLLNEAGTLPGNLIQTSPPMTKKSRNPPVPGYSIIDLDLSKYDKLSTRFEREQSEVTDFLKSGIALSIALSAISARP